MGSYENFTKMVFKDHYNTLEKSQRKEFRDRCINEGGIKFDTFYGKLRRNCFSKLEMEFMNNVLVDMGLQPFWELP